MSLKTLNVVILTYLNLKQGKFLSRFLELDPSSKSLRKLLVSLNSTRFSYEILEKEYFNRSQDSKSLLRVATDETDLDLAIRAGKKLY